MSEDRIAIALTGEQIEALLECFRRAQMTGREALFLMPIYAEMKRALKELQSEHAD